MTCVAATDDTYGTPYTGEIIWAVDARTIDVTEVTANDGQWHTVCVYISSDVRQAQHVDLYIPQCPRDAITRKSGIENQEYALTSPVLKLPRNRSPPDKSTG